MQLSESQRQFYDNQGYLVFPDLFSPHEIELLKSETDRLSAMETECIFRADDIATIYACHETNGPTASRPFHVASRLPRTLGIAQQLVGKELYIYNSKINLKKAITGAPMLWHQDYGYWRLDHMPEPRAATLMIALGDVNEVSGALYVIPQSHKLGPQKHSPTLVGAHKQFAVDRETEIALMSSLPTPVPLSGPAGMAALFHCNLIHGSGQNLSAFDRWQAYFAYNPVDNAPGLSSRDRPAHMKSRNFQPLSLAEGDVLA